VIAYTEPAEVVAVRAQIAELKADIDAHERVPLSDAEAHKRVDAIVATHGARVPSKQILGHLIYAGSTAIGWPIDHDGAPIEPSAFDLACALNPERMRADLRALIAASDHSRGPANAERAKRLTKLRAELREAEIEEERLIGQFLAHGVNVHRRIDCNPEIVLTTE
jgi:hypothetical protein